MYFPILHIKSLRKIVFAELEKRIPLAAQTSHCAELEELQELLHFPEEVALRLADTEYQLFYQVIILSGHFFYIIIMYVCTVDAARYNVLLGACLLLWDRVLLFYFLFYLFVIILKLPLYLKMI